MKKLDVETLRVDSFATAHSAAAQIAITATLTLGGPCEIPMSAYCTGPTGCSSCESVTVPITVPVTVSGPDV